jgi:hypothetical protein
MKNIIIFLFLCLVSCANSENSEITECTEWAVLREYVIADNELTIPENSNLEKLINHQVTLKGYCRKIAPDFSKYFLTEDNYSEWELENTSVLFDAEKYKPILDSTYEVTGILTIQEFSDGKLIYELKNAKIK